MKILTLALIVAMLGTTGFSASARDEPLSRAAGWNATETRDVPESYTLAGPTGEMTGMRITEAGTVIPVNLPGNASEAAKMNQLYLPGNIDGIDMIVRDVSKPDSVVSMDITDMVIVTAGKDTVHYDLSGDPITATYSMSLNRGRIDLNNMSGYRTTEGVLDQTNLSMGDEGIFIHLDAASGRYDPTKSLLSVYGISILYPDGRARSYDLKSPITATYYRDAGVIIFSGNTPLTSEVGRQLDTMKPVENPVYNGTVSIDRLREESMMGTTLKI